MIVNNILFSYMHIQRYFHEGMVMELIPGQTPSMKAVDAINPKDSVDGGKYYTY